MRAARGLTRLAYRPDMAELSPQGLKVLIEVARRGSFTAAAEALGYTQSAISRQIGALESAAGSPLFERQARGVRATPAGEVLLRHAERVAAQLEAAGLELAGLRDRLAGRVVLGAYPTIAAGLVPRAIAHVVRRHPDLSVSLREASSATLLQRLTAGRIEVAVVATGEGLPDVDLTPLRTRAISTGTGLGVALSAQHPLSTSELIDVEVLAHEAWIVGVGAEGEPHFGAWPTLARPRVAFEAQGWPTRLGLVAAGLGICLVPGFAAGIVPRGVVWRPVQDPALRLERQTLIVTAVNPSGAVDAVVRAIEGEASRWGRA